MAERVGSIPPEEPGVWTIHLPLELNEPEESSVDKLLRLIKGDEVTWVDPDTGVEHRLQLPEGEAEEALGIDRFQDQNDSEEKTARNRARRPT